MCVWEELFVYRHPPVRSGPLCVGVMITSVTCSYPRQPVDDRCVPLECLWGQFRGTSALGQAYIFVCHYTATALSLPGDGIAFTRRRPYYYTTMGEVTYGGREAAGGE